MSKTSLPLGLDPESLKVWLVLAVLGFGLLLGRLLFSRFIRRMVKGGFIGEHIGRRLVVSARIATWLSILFLSLHLSGAVSELWTILTATLAALAVGFVANWSLLSNMTAGLLILIFRPFRVEDRISIWEGDKEVAVGLVIDLNLMFVSIETDVGSLKRISNNLLFQRLIEVHRERGERTSVAQDREMPFFHRRHDD